MESWLPWLTDREHLLTDLLPDDALGAAGRAEAHARPRPGAARRRGVAGGDARGHVGRGGRARPAAALARLRPPARAHRRRRGVAARRRPTAPTRRASRRARSTRWSATPTRSARRLRALARRGLPRRARGGGHRFGATAARRARRRGSRRRPRAHPRRARCGWWSRRSSAASCSRARSSRSSPRPTSPVVDACTAGRAARAAVRTTTTTLEPGDYVVHYQHGVGRYLEMKPLAHGRHRARLPAARVQGRQGLRAHRPGRDSCASTPAARRPRSTAWAAPTSRSNGRASAARCARSPRSSWCCTASGSRRPATPSVPTRRGSTRSRRRSRSRRRPTSCRRSTTSRATWSAPVPMDRLVCGDVGYGKTEVAVRAAFKAVQDGKQVVVLVPTTLLAGPARPDVPRALRQLPGAGRGAVAVPQPPRSRRRSCATSSRARSTC